MYQHPAKVIPSKLERKRGGGEEEGVGTGLEEGGPKRRYTGRRQRSGCEVGGNNAMERKKR